MAFEIEEFAKSCYIEKLLFSDAIISHATRHLTIFESEAMQSIIDLYMRFTGKQYSTMHKILSMVPGFIVFLVISPFVIFLLSSYISKFIPVTFPRPLEYAVMAIAMILAVMLMSWALIELWIKGGGTPAPITPTSKLVTSGPYMWCRNPIELGTNIYFLGLGIYFDSLVTGILCMSFGLVLGTIYIKFIEEKEMLVRFGKPYDTYLHSVPFMTLSFLFRLKPEKKVK